MIISMNVSHFVKICQVLTILHQIMCMGVANFGTRCRFMNVSLTFNHNIKYTLSASTDGSSFLTCTHTVLTATFHVKLSFGFNQQTSSILLHHMFWTGTSSAIALSNYTGQVPQRKQKLATATSISQAV